MSKKSWKPSIVAGVCSGAVCSLGSPLILSIIASSLSGGSDAFYQSVYGWLPDYGLITGTLFFACLSGLSGMLLKKHFPRIDNGMTGAVGVTSYFVIIALIMMIIIAGV